MGSWLFVLPRFIYILQELKRDRWLPTFAGRKAAASPATGLFKSHLEEQSRLVQQALTVEAGAIPQPFQRIVR
jgi:2-oxoglutarate dehydrogenase E1 component